MNIVVGILIPVSLLALATHRIRISRNGNRFSRPTGMVNPLTQMLVFPGLAQLCRAPVISDDIINPVLRDATGVANIMSLAGMTFGALSAIPIFSVSSFVTGRTVTPRVQLGLAAAITAAMVLTFLRTPMAHVPTSYMSNDFPVTGPVMAYWFAFLAPLAAALAIGCGYIVRELRWIRGPFARALAGIALCETLGLAYCLFKAYNLYLQRAGIENFWHLHAKLISIALGLAAVSAAGICASVYTFYTLRDRFHRYRLLRIFGARWLAARAANPAVVLDRTEVFRPTRRMCWAASLTGTTAYRLRIELADHQHQTGAATAATRPSIA
ncbi:hypothetical protein [Nocardia sp. NBC_00511]|uniref:hypothetical protein n=1 Tax=Nocardia sp. NBC_00511 TaxID=2903591 RepID=UPI0030E5B289